MKRMFLAAYLILLTSMGSAFANECVNYQNYLRVVGGLPLESDARAIEIVGDLLYVGVDRTLYNDAILHIFDLSDPLDIQPVGSYESPGDWTKLLLVQGGQAYFGVDSYIRRVDISDPANPVASGASNVISSAQDMLLEGDLLYVASIDLGLRILDASNFYPPSVISLTDVGGSARSIAKLGDYLYVGVDTNTDEFLHVYDVSDPTSPVLVDITEFNHYPRDLAIYSGHLYLANYNDGLFVLDLADPAHPIEVAHPEGSAVCQDLSINNDVLYTAGVGSGLQFYDLSDPADPQFQGMMRLPIDTWELVVMEDHAILMGTDLVTVELTHLDMAPLLATASQELSGSEIVLDGDLAYVPVGSYPYDPGAFQIWSLHDPENVQLIGEMETQGGAMDVVIDGDIAYLTWYAHAPEIGTVHVISVDVSDPSTPVPLGGDIWFPGYYSIDIALNGNYLYYVGSSHHLHVLDVSDPANIVDVYSFPTGTVPYQLVLDGDILYMPRDYHGLRVYDVSDPALPVAIGNTNLLGDCKQIILDGDRAFLKAPVGCYILDDSDPSSPTVISLMGDEASMSFNGIALKHERLYGNYGAGVEIFDIADPSAPTILGSVNLPWLSGSELFDLGDYLMTVTTDGLGYIAYDCYGVTSLPPVAPLARLDVWPNPFNPRVTIRFSLEEPAEVRISVHDLSGRLVALLSDGSMMAGEHDFVWDGRNIEGRPVSSGVYLARLEADGMVRETTKLTLLQ